MSAHWRIALRYAAWVSAGAVLAGVGIWFLYGASYAGAFFYGVAMGLLSFVSMAGTVSLVSERLSKAATLMVGAGSFVARCVFVAGALWIPAYLSLWPVTAMLCGFAAVYVAENVVLALMMPRKISSPDVERPERETEERKVGT